MEKVMPKVIDIRPKDIHILMEMSLEELRMIYTAMNLATISYDGKAEKEVQATVYFKSQFYDFVEQTIERIENGS
jgi:hypothetical protein